jgi:hypothetical protein
MKTLLTLALIGVAAIAEAGNTKTNLTLASGAVYTNVVIMRAEPDGLTVMKSSGVVKIPFAQLTPEIQAAYGYTPEKAAAYQKQVAANMKRLVEKQTAEASQAAAKAEADKQPKYQVSGLVIEKTPDGLLVKCNAPYRPRRDSMTSIGGSIGATPVPDKEALPAAHGTILLVGYAGEASAVDGTMINATARKNGTYSYEDTEGGNSTVQKYIVVN